MRNGWPALLLGLALASGPAFGRPAVQAGSEDCLACHSDPALTSASGKTVAVNQAAFEASIHARAGMSCVDCHTDLRQVADFPHAERLKPADCSACHEPEARELAASVHGQSGAGEGQAVSCRDCHGTHDVRAGDDFESRTFSLNLPGTCLACHAEKVQAGRGGEFVRLYEKSVHFRALEGAGLTMSANCGSCHGAHGVKSVRDPASEVSRTNIIKTCGRCHVGIERDYLEGVHGKDYLRGGKDVPVCTDCHNEHDILPPAEAESSVYATKVAGVCSRCHDDMALARKYGLLPDRMKTYAESYHGTASRFGEVRVANCGSCHGFHDIRDSSDPRSSVYPGNLPATCGRCHPGATQHFAEGKIHYVARETIDFRDRSPHIVKSVYIVVISAIIAVFLMFIAADLLHRALKRGRHD
jgi:nitrate/TMAO reductase-like tetraheme cytochrome c subunit